MLRFSAHKFLNKLLAFCMSLLFLQALIADIVHVERVQHAYCPTHQEVTHDIAHVDAVRANQLANQNNIDHGGLALPDHNPLNGDHKNAPFDCGDLIWLAANTDTVFTNTFDFTIPPPLLATLPDPKSTRFERDSYPAIALHFHASGLSPPVLI